MARRQRRGDGVLPGDHPEPGERQAFSCQTLDAV
jgi:hypothetical protein